MALGRKQRRIEALEHRVSELEERLCPCESHDWKQVGSTAYSDGSGLCFEYLYKCRRCGKEKWDWQ